MTKNRANLTVDHGSEWDPFVRLIKARFDAQYDGSIKSGEGPQRWAWERYFSEGKDRRADEREAIRCTRATHERAIRIANAVCTQARRAGFDIAMGYCCTYIALRRDGAQSALRIVEPCFRANTDHISKDERASVYDHGLIGTGWLELHINEHHWPPRTTFRERSGIDLVEQARAILEALERSHAVRVVEANEARRREAAVQRARAEREANERQLANERKRREELIRNASTWDAADQIRKYIAAMSQRATSADSQVLEGFDEWRVWALGVAEEMERESSSVLRNGASRPIDVD